MAGRRSMMTTNPLLASVAAYLRERGFQAEFLEDETVRLGVTLDDGMGVMLHIIPDVARNVLLVYGYSPEMWRVPDERRIAVAEYLIRANYDLPIGNFELDMEDGEVRYKTSVPAVEPEIALPLIHELFRANLYTIQTYAGGVTEVIFGADPALAIAKAEGVADESWDGDEEDE